MWGRIYNTEKNPKRPVWLDWKEKAIQNHVVPCGDFVKLGIL